jgi:pyocin large subunit-like protein
MWAGKATSWTVGGSNPVRARFLAPVHTGREAHAASYTLYTGSFPGVMRTGSSVNNAPLSSTADEESLVVYL